MKIVFRIAMFAVLAALGVGLWLVLFPGPEKIIRQRLAELARTVSSSPGEGDLARLAAAHRVAEFFSTNVELAVELPELAHNSLVDRNEIMQADLVARAKTGGLNVQFSDINVVVLPDQQSVVADLTVQANISSGHDSFVQQMKFIFRKIDGQWLITRVETVRTLSRLRSRFRHFELCTAPGSFHS